MTSDGSTAASAPPPQSTTAPPPIGSQLPAGHDNIQRGAASSLEDPIPATQIQFNIAPQAGPVDGGTIITIVGARFSASTSVEFGSQAAAEVHVINDRLLTAIVPAGDPGSVEVKLRGLNGSVSPTSEPVIGSFEYYVLPPDDGGDGDGDGMTDVQELTGWEVWVDAFGLGLGQDTFGNVVRYTCISDPRSDDTDADGLADLDEFLAKADARKADTDGDGLNDFEEVTRWLTSPVALDSDGDSRSPSHGLAPNSALFDGAELITAGFENTARGLIISEYVEGTGHNHAIELYNGTDQPIDLEAEFYSLLVDIGTRYEEVLLQGVVPPRSAFVIADPRADAAVLATADLVTPLEFDGNGFVELYGKTGVVDAVGDRLGPPGFGSPAQDQDSAGGGNTPTPIAVSPWQSFTPGESGLLSTIRVKGLYNHDNFWRDVKIDVYEGEGVTGALLGSGTAGIHPTALDWEDYDFAIGGVRVVAGQRYTFQLSLVAPAVSISVRYRADNPYPDGQQGAGDIPAPSRDFGFTTFVRPIGFEGWGQGDANTVDHTLRRKAPVCEANADVNVAFNPATQWVGFPIDTFGGLGSHRALCTHRMVTGGTSPTLEDTDGDGKTDYEEFDNPSRDSQVAQLPRASLDVADSVDMRLLVEYSDARGIEEEYSQSYGRSNSSTSSRSFGTSIEVGLTFSQEIESQGGTDSHVRHQFSAEQNITAGINWEIGSENTFESHQEFSSAHAQSQERVETTTGGELRAGIVLRNTGPIPFTLSNFAITVRQFIPDLAARSPNDPRAGVFRTVGTLVPQVSSVTLAPGEQSSVLEMEDADVNPQIVREFLANPSGLFLEPAAFELLNQEGIDYRFLNDITRSRTAQLTIDYQDPAVPAEEYYIATNVNRNPDSSLAGVTLGKALRDALRLNRSETAHAQGGYVVQPRNGTGPMALVSIRGMGPHAVPGSKWIVAGNSENVFVDENLDGMSDVAFEDIVLKPGDQLHLVLSRDDDGDGLPLIEERSYGTSDAPGNADTDRDGVDDLQEVEGWVVHVNNTTRNVVADGRTVDTDLDGLSDQDEFVGADGIPQGTSGDANDATDPTSVDTDDDGLPDGTDPNPTLKARRLYVRKGAGGAGDGSNWANAFPELAAALNHTYLSNHNNSNPVDDVSEIWVAAGEYKPTSLPRMTTIFASDPLPRGATFELYENVALYGGFVGTESKRGERNPDPITNGTALSGDLLGNDSGLLPDIRYDHASRQDNVHNVTRIPPIPSAAIIFDGFTVRNGNARGTEAGMLPQSSGAGMYARRQPGPTPISDTALKIRNALFAYNTAADRAAGAFLHDMGDVSFSNCTFTLNLSGVTGSTTIGGGLVLQDVRASLEKCDFRDNQARDGAALFVWRVNVPTEVSLNGCTFVRNTGHFTGAVRSDNATLKLANCSFRGNKAGTVSGIGGGLTINGGSAVATSCDFWRNSAAEGGGAVYSLNQAQVLLLNCTVANNTTGNSTNFFRAGTLFADTGDLNAVNCILWGNQLLLNDAPNNPSPLTLEQVQFYGGVGVRTLDVRNSCVQGLESFSGFGNIGDDPRLVNIATGNLNLRSESPCIEGGALVLDADPFAGGIQRMPDLDLAGRVRLLDFDGDGTAVVDMGAFEFRGDD